MSAELDTVAVTGASGQLGRLVLQHLQAMHPGRIVAITRRPDTLADAARQGVVVRQGDFDDAASLRHAFAGVNRALVISTDAHDVPGRRVRQHETAVQAARASGVQHLLYTSLTRCEPGSPMKIAPDHWATEQLLAHSGLGHTVLRNNLYAEIVLEFLPAALQHGRLFAAAGDGAVAWVARDDVARAAAAALHAPPAGGPVFDITGRAPVSYAELAALASAVTGRPLNYHAVSAQDIAEGMSRAGLPLHVVEVLLSFQLAAARGDLATCSTTVEQLTGQPPLALSDFLRQQAGRLSGVAA